MIVKRFRVQLHVWWELGSARLDCEMIEVRCREGLASVWRRRMGGGENTGYDSSGLCARGSSSDSAGDSKEILRGSRYASRDTVMRADEGEGGPPWEVGGGRAGRGSGLRGGGVRAGEGGAEASDSGVWKPRGEAGLSGVWYPRDASESPRTSGTCSDC